MNKKRKTQKMRLELLTEVRQEYSMKVKRQLVKKWMSWEYTRKLGGYREYNKQGISKSEGKKTKK